MPTPVGAARQCLSDAAAAVLDDAVAVARRRSHVQTTTLHVVSALLAAPSSPLREACTRAWSSAYSPRLQFRALELCVGVALDRVSASKSAAAAADEPPVSNSLMAAIKRSQASQRRHPETFHLYQQQLSSSSQNSPSISAIKVELKHFLTSILDDPIVSRVFGDAGFRTQEIKLSVLNPLAMARFAVTASRPPPLFACSPDNFELDRRAHSFPFIEAAAKEKLDENPRKIGEVLLKKTRRNPLLIGASGGEAYRSFVDCLKKRESGVVPKELDGLSVVSIEREISECIDERLSGAMMGLKFKNVDESVKDCQTPGIIANCGDFKEFLDAELVGVVSNVVSKLKRLLIDHGGKLWLIGFLADDNDYKKLVEQFPSIETDLDLHLLPITASSMEGKPFKSSLMRSFVPFGGFFSMSSELQSPCTNLMKPMKLCNSCNEKYEKEVSDLQKGGSTDSVADKQSVHLSSWLQIAECETRKGSCTEEAKKDKTVLDARVMALHRKWSSICQRLHYSWAPQVDTTLPMPKPHTSIATTLQHVPIRKDAVSVGSLSNGNNVSNLSPCMPSDWQTNSPPKQNVPRPAKLSASVTAQAELPAQGLGLNDFQNSSSSKQRTSLPIACTSSSSAVSVGTELTLGTLFGSSEEFRRNPNLQDDCSDVRKSESSRSHEKSQSQISQSSSCSHHGKQMYAKDLGHQWNVLAEKIYWQSEAIQTISRAVSCCRNENARYHCSRKRNVWLSFLGPDKVGKRKIAASVAEIEFGRNDHLLYLDLCTRDMKPVNYIVDCSDLRYLKMQSNRELIVDYLAEELSKHPDSVVLLENVEKADIMVQRGLSEAIKTGKLQDSLGRPISINNNIFILASTSLKGSKDLFFGKQAPDFPEETILEAKNLQMQILVEPTGDVYSRNSTACVSLFPSEIISNRFSSSKRKSMNDGSTKGEISKRACQMSRSFIDLNLPVDGMGEDSDIDKSDDDYSDDSEVWKWMEQLLEHVDENVVSKPFDFDSLSRKILKDIDVRLRKIFGATVILEIDRQVMVQILAAAWLTEREDALENWIEQVLCTGIDEARQRCNGVSDYVLKLVPCDGLVVKAQAPRVCLPAKINV